jgi:hypothetical protein
MSNYLAVATVTETLRQLLDVVVRKFDPGAKATAVRPSVSGSSGPPDLGVNVYLYHVNRHAGFTNSDLPVRRVDGSLAGRPRAALTLDYLLSFYAKDNELHAQALLGSVIQILHAQPVLSPGMITAVTVSDPPTFLFPSNLADEIEHVKFTPLSLTLDDLSKLWSTFFQTPYALSLAYQASVVFIEGEETPPEILPVLEPRFFVNVFTDPHIDAAVPLLPADKVILTGSSIRILGRDLQGSENAVFIDGNEIVAGAVSIVSNLEIDVALPVEISAGKHLLFIQKIISGAEVPHPVRIMSNIVPLVVRNP